MLTQLLRAKLHQARVTAADVNYIGSITIDAELLEQVGMLPYERVQVVDLENGNRLETYIIQGEPGSGTIQLNGAAAHLVRPGDRVIIMAYTLVPLPLHGQWTPKVALLDHHNRICQWLVEGPAAAVADGASMAGLAGLAG
jgi:aspartate 1-decarboxylase